MIFVLEAEISLFYVANASNRLFSPELDYERHSLDLQLKYALDSKAPR